MISRIMKAWPHSAEAIERSMGQLDDAERAKILGLNSARISIYLYRNVISVSPTRQIGRKGWCSLMTLRCEAR